MQFLYGLEHCSDSSLQPFEGKPCARYPSEPKAPSASSYVRHLAATPVGRLVTGEAEVTKVDGRQIEFSVRATEGAKEIA